MTWGSNGSRLPAWWWTALVGALIAAALGVPTVPIVLLLVFLSVLLEGRSR